VTSRLRAPVRLLTPIGRGLVVTGVVAAVLSQRFHWQEFTQLAVLAFGLVVLGVAWQLLPGSPDADFMLRHHRLVEGSPPPTATVRVQAGAAPLLFPKVVLPVGGERVQLRLPFLGPFAHHTEEVRLPVMPRGVHVVGPVTYEKTDPVGVITRRSGSGQTVELFVSPHVTDLPLFAAGLTNDLDGATSQQLSMSDLAFHALREYVPGDDLRHVHWRSSAKAGELLVRQYHETRRSHVTVLVDGARSSYPRLRDFELAVSAATSIALRAVRDDFDTYLRCGAHWDRGRNATVMTDVACRFVVEVEDLYLRHATAAAQSRTRPGLVVQVTGATRDLVELDAVAQQCGRGAEWLVVRADSEGQARVRDSSTLRELSIPDLASLQQLMSRCTR